MLMMLMILIDSGADAGDADNNCICTAGLLPMVKLPSVAAT